MPINLSVRVVTSCVLAIGMFFVATASAQTPQLVFEREKPLDSTVIKAAAEKADTGRMMPGYKDISGYDTPGYCLAGIRRYTTLVWRRGEQDTLPQLTSSDTLPSQAIETGRKCIEKFSLEDLPSSELYSLIRVALIAGEMDKAHAALNYWISISPDAREQGYAVFDAIFAALRNPPPRLDVAERWMGHFDSLGRESFEPRVEALNRLTEFARMQFDTAAIIRLNLARHEFLKTLTAEELKVARANLGTVFQDSLYILWYKLPSAELPEAIGMLADNLLKNDHSQMASIAMKYWNYQATIPGKPMRDFPVFAQFPDRDEKSLYTPGRVTILVKSRVGDGRMDRRLASYKRLHEKYADHGLDIVLVLHTSGFLWASPPLSTEEEARIIAWYYRDHFDLPFKVVVEETQFIKRADGRRMGERALFDRMYEPIFATGVIVGRDGNVSTLNMGFHSEAALEAFIVRELGKGQ